MNGFGRAQRWFSKLSERQQLGCLFLFALSIRIVYLYQIKDAVFFQVLLGDGQTYEAWAQQIGQDFWGKQAFFQAPLYPYFLAAIYALFGHDLVAVRVSQMLLGSCACLLLARAVSSFFSKRIGLWSGLLLAVYGPALFFDGIVQKASLDLFLTTLLLFFLGQVEERDHRRSPALAGVVLGCLALTRENALIWAPCLIIWFALRQPSTALRDSLRRRILPFGLGMALALAPVALRNFAISGQFFLTTSQFGQNFYIGNNPEADGTYQSLRFGGGGAEAERKDSIELAEAALGRKLNAAEVSRYWSQRALSFMAQQPGRSLGLLVKKWFLVWNARELPDSDEPLVYADESWLLSGASLLFSFATLCPLALAGAWLTLRDRRRLLLWHALALSLAASTALFFVFARYRYPLVPLLIPFAVLAGLELAGRLRAHQYLQALRLAPAIAAGIAITHLGVLPLEHPRATAYYDVAVSLERLERWDEAKASYREALAANQDFVEAHVNLGSLLARNGDFEQAAEHEEAALRLKPDAALAHADLGNIRFEQNRFGEAKAEYEQTLKLDPNQPQAREGLAAVDEQLGAQSKHPGEVPQSSH